MICIIAIRGGSIGLPNKNILPLNGKPLVCHTIDTAIDSNCFESIVVTTDSLDYIDLLKDYYAEQLIYIHRPKELAKDNTPNSDVLLHVFDQLKCDDDTRFVQLQATSPLRTTKYLKDVISKFTERYDSVITVKPFDRNIHLVSTMENNIFNLQLDNQSKTNRQAQGDLYYPDGSIWISKVGTFKKYKTYYTSKTYGYVSPSWSHYDIDTLLDFQVVEYLMQRMR